MVDMPDSTLMAYADGELAPESCKAVEAVLAADPAARERLAAFTSTRREGLAPLFDPVIGEPVPEQLRDLVLGFSTGLNRAMASRSAQWRTSGLLASVQGWFVPPPVMSWASVAVALLLGIGTGWMLGRGTVGTDRVETRARVLKGLGVATGPLTRALDGTPSGTLVSWHDDAGDTVNFKAVLSFLSQDQRYCRQYELSDASGSAFGGLACRRGDAWQVEIYARTPAKAVARGRNSVPAGQSSPVDEAAMDMLSISGEVLANGREMELIRDGWRIRP